ncbi:hypothetical protein [Paraburkholderia youngii]|uniref:Uncharacterized protein n=1 Tax=Paraburkholderia youngii TaxID=2782701 RepID=A0A7Y6JZ58_9BURK|nr:hypothetical protein [Paraburkholderia youngii]NUY01436.1 hypothetical protein [Paraburkholderia youngii]
MALTKKQIDKAGRFYGLAMAAHADSGGATSADESAVMDRSRDIAIAALARLGFAPSDTVGISDCINAVRNG